MEDKKVKTPEVEIKNELKEGQVIVNVGKDTWLSKVIIIKVEK